MVVRRRIKVKSLTWGTRSWGIRQDQTVSVVGKGLVDVGEHMCAPSPLGCMVRDASLLAEWLG